MITDIDNSQVIVQPEYYALGGTRLRVTLEESGKMIAQEVGTAAENAPLVLKVKKAKLWSPDSPFLYDLRYEILDSGRQSTRNQDERTNGFSVGKQ